MTVSADLTTMTAVELSGAIKNRKVSCREVMTAYLARIDRLNPKVNAIVALRDEAELLREADERDEDLARGDWRGPLHGFPHAVKDLSPVRGILSTEGSPILKDFVGKEDSIFVERLRRGGVVFIGKTNTPEFGLGSQTYNEVYGATRNPYDLSKTAGGSSGGAATALALRLQPVADGSDFGGSLRNPAGYNNVIGFRPSYGRVPAGPNKEIFFQQLSTDGAMGRNVADTAMLLSVMAGPDSRAPLSIDQNPAVFAEPLKHDPRGTRIGWLGDMGKMPMEPGVLDLCRKALGDFEALGCVVEEASIDFPVEKIWRTFVTLRHFFMIGRLQAYYNDPAKRALLKPEAVWEVENGLRLSAIQIHEAVAARAAWYQALRRAFEKFDFLVLPSSQVFPFDVTTHWPSEIAGTKMDSYHRWMEVMGPATLSTCPVIGLPAGFNEAGLPMGIQVMGPRQADLALLRLAYAYDEATGWAAKRPPPLD